jgi:hypothetical protein
LITVRSLARHRQALFDEVRRAASRRVRLDQRNAAGDEQQGNRVAKCRQHRCSTETAAEAGGRLPFGEQCRGPRGGEAEYISEVVAGIGQQGERMRRGVAVRMPMIVTVVAVMPMPVVVIRHLLSILARGGRLPRYIILLHEHVFSH